jgi:DNA-binding NtrC family response regulator
MSLRRVVTVGQETEVHQLARQVGRDVFAADDLPEALDIVETTNPDLVLFDHRFSPACIREFLDIHLRRNKNSNVHVVVVGSAEDDTEASAEFIQMGAYDYLRGKQDHHRLSQIVNQIRNKLKAGASKRKNISDFFIDDLSASVCMAGQSEAILNTLKMIEVVAGSRCNPVLIVGETGTGKELAAKAMHTLRHPDKPFIAVNCAVLTANLLESELFGHVKGSFTGADQEKTGLLELAGSGTIFLDEISEIPINLQAKLLRMLQDKTFRKVGGVKDITCNATIITSSNRNLKSEVEANRFRRDLYYRLDICPITIAPLRTAERKKDIQLLAEYFIRTSTICPEKTDKITSMTKLAIEALQEHNWPGNVRELQNVIERAILLETTDKIGMSSIVIASSNYGELSANTTSERIKDFSLDKAERELIVRALQETGWQKTQAAALLEITRATLYAKIKNYNIEKGSYTAGDTRIQKSEFTESSEELWDKISTPPLRGAGPVPSLPEPVTAA